MGFEFESFQLLLRHHRIQYTVHTVHYIARMASLTEALQVSIVKEIGVAIDKLKLSVMKKLSRQKAHLKSFPEASINEVFI